MSKTLIIAEKPSVAADIARALGGFTRQGDYFESDDYVLSSAVGHLVEITVPPEQEVKRGKWSFANLPIIPPHFDLKPIAKSEDRLKLLSKLIRRKDVDALINACDAGREGELIFRLVAEHAKAKQPVRRLWMQSMTPAAIREGFTRLRDDATMRPLADAARCRAEADWLVGINGTRAMTAFNSRDGGFYLTTVGRVQTPTLAIVVEREERIKKFVVREYHEVRADFEAAAGSYEGRWFDPGFRKSEDDPEARAERIWGPERAEAIVAECRDRPGSVSEESRATSQLSPPLFDLTSLQREANGRFGYSAKTTLSIAQALYEKHKVLTYPRTDSRALPSDYLPVAQDTMKALSADSELGGFAQQVLSNSWIKPNPRVFDNAKVSDHFAIIPTVQAPGNLSDAEQRIYDLVRRRFLAVFYPAAQFMVTTRITTVASHQFKTDGKVLVAPGWMEIYGKEAAGSEAGLCPVTEGETVQTTDVRAVALATRPPARYNEATLLSAMEGAGKLLEDDELRAAMSAKGLGTPATRATIIEGLISENYLIREGRELIPTTKAHQLLRLLRGLEVTELTAPELTGEWETKLAQIERGGLSRPQFMAEIAEMTRQIVERARNYDSTDVPGDYATLTTPCPKCGGVVAENYKRYACQSCDFSITRTPSSRQLEVAEAEALLRDRVVGPLEGFRSKMGRPFAALLRINAEDRLEFDFGRDDQDNESEEPPDFTGQEPLGACPKCGSPVYEHGLSYVCEHALGAARSCDFRSGRIILRQSVEPEQMKKLLADGRTDLLTDFVSNRTGRKFKAFLVRGADNKVGFEFEPRVKREGAAAKRKPAAGKTAAAGKAGTGKAAEGKAGAAKTGAAKSAAGKTAAGKAGAAKPAARKTVKKKAVARKTTAKKADA